VGEREPAVTTQGVIAYRARMHELAASGERNKRQQAAGRAEVGAANRAEQVKS
jgi:hypothetical protein